MARLKFNDLQATLATALTSGTTTIDFGTAPTYNGGTALPTLTGSDYVPLALVDAVTGRLKEIVYLTAYTTAGTTGTISRGKEGTSGVAHSVGAKIYNAPTVLDIGVPTYLLEAGITTLPAGSPEGIVYRKATRIVYDFKNLTGGATPNLPAGWSRRGTLASESSDASGYQATYDAGEFIECNIPASGNYIWEGKIVSGTVSGIMQGPATYNGSGGGCIATWYNSPSGLLFGGLSGYAYSSAFASGGGTPAHPARFRIRRDGTNHYASQSTDDGASWSAEVALAGVAVPPTKIAFGNGFGSAAMKIAEGIFTALDGGLLGYWDGTQIKAFA